jgi:hypothetical protein
MLSLPECFALCEALLGLDALLLLFLLALQPLALRSLCLDLELAPLVYNGARDLCQLCGSLHALPDGLHLILYLVCGILQLQLLLLKL